VSLADTTVGIVGVGRMGSAMARALHGHARVLGWDLREVLGVPIEMAATAAELPPACDLLLLALPSPRETREVMLEHDFRAAFAASSCVALDMSTSDPGSLRALARELGTASARILDAPVLGRPDRCGAWTLPVGGDDTLLAAARPVLERLAARVEHVGPLGSGHTVKLLNNLMFAAINVVTAEVVAACDRLDLPPATFVDLVANSAAATVSPLFRDLGPRMLGAAGDPVFTVALLAKDLQLAARMCEDAGAALVSARASQIVLTQALRSGLGDLDTAAIVSWYRGEVPHGAG
jgi:3-hydroxyisobutyrate dehydrogenase-like beta-hydroxyacid dehydrogenase